MFDIGAGVELELEDKSFEAEPDTVTDLKG